MNDEASGEGDDELGQVLVSMLKEAGLEGIDSCINAQFSYLFDDGTPALIEVHMHAVTPVDQN